MGLTPQKAGESRETLAELGARRTNPYLGLDFVLSRVSTSDKGALRLPEIPCGGKDLKNGAKETRTPDPLHAMQLVRSSEFACGNRKKPSVKGISEKLAFKPLWLARASYGGFALKIALSF